MGECDVVPDEVLHLLRERIGRSLDEWPLELDSRGHREHVAALLARLGDSTYYELLDLEPTAGAEEIHDAYNRLARLVHPRHVGRLGLQGRHATLELLFERLTRAYLTLSHPHRRKLYDWEAGPFGTEQTQAASRPDEQRQLARGLFERAARMIEVEEYHYAVELLRRASQIDPRSEYFALLGDIQSKNPYWLRQAADSYRSAIRFGAETPHLQAALDEIEDRLKRAQAPPPPAAVAPPERQRRARA